jgi:hypothetical protein
MQEKINTNEAGSELTPERYLALAERLSGFSEGFPFSGIEATAYTKLKAESEEFPGFATHIDDLIKRFEIEGIKVVIEKGKVFVLPCGSMDVENDSIFPRFLNLDSSMHSSLQELIRAGKQK